MAVVIGQRWEIYPYNRAKFEILKKGEKIVVNGTPDFGDAVIQLISPDGVKTVEEIYMDYKNGAGSPSRTAEVQAQIDAETLESAKEYADEVAKNEWLKPVNTVAELNIDTAGLSNKKNYLCKVIADPEESGVYQAVAGWVGVPAWALFDDSVDLVNEQEMATAIENAVNDEAEERREADDGKADKVPEAIENNFVAFDDEGNIKDSGKKTASFIQQNEKGASNGVADLDANGKIRKTQLPATEGLLAVTTDETLTGDGAESIPLGINKDWLLPLFLTEPVQLLNEPFVVASNKRKITIKGGTRLKLGDDIFYTQQDIELNLPGILDTGSIENGKDYCLYLIHGGNGLDVKASLSETAPDGLSPVNVKKFGGLHSLCADAGTNLTFTIGGVSKLSSEHPLHGYVAGDILPKSVWCLNHLPHSKPNGMVYIDSLDFWCDIYLQSGSGANTKSEYGENSPTSSKGRITRNRQIGDFVEDMFCVNKALLSDEEFAAAALGSNEKTTFAGASEAGATTNGAGGRVDTAGRRMISIYGCEEMCGSLWQFLRDQGPTGGSGWNGQNGGKGDFYGSCMVLLAGGSWSYGSYCGSRTRAATISRAYVCGYRRSGAEPSEANFSLLSVLCAF